MEETRIRSPNVGAAHTLTSNLPLDALGPGNSTEGTYPSNDASNESSRLGGGGAEEGGVRGGTNEMVASMVSEALSDLFAHSLMPPPITGCSISIADPWDGTIVPPPLESRGLGQPGGRIIRAQV